MGLGFRVEKSVDNVWSGMDRYGHGMDRVWQYEPGMSKVWKYEEV